MPSAYLLAKDQIEQARAILANEVWFDPQVDHLFELALYRLQELEATTMASAPLRPVSTSRPLPSERQARLRFMPWLDP